MKLGSQSEYRIGRYCVQCGICIRMCPARAIHIADNGGYYIDQKMCVRCGKCERLCRAHAISRADKAGSDS